MSTLKDPMFVRGVETTHPFKKEGPTKGKGEINQKEGGGIHIRGKKILGSMCAECYRKGDLGRRVRAPWNGETFRAISGQKRLIPQLKGKRAREDRRNRRGKAKKKKERHRKRVFSGGGRKREKKKNLSKEKGDFLGKKVCGKSSESFPQASEVWARVKARHLTRKGGVTPRSRGGTRACLPLRSKRVGGEGKKQSRRGERKLSALLEKATP